MNLCRSTEHEEALRSIALQLQVFWFSVLILIFFQRFLSYVTPLRFYLPRPIVRIEAKMNENWKKVGGWGIRKIPLSMFPYLPRHGRRRQSSTSPSPPFQDLLLTFLCHFTLSQVGLSLGGGDFVDSRTMWVGYTVTDYAVVEQKFMNLTTEKWSAKTYLSGGQWGVGLHYQHRGNVANPYLQRQSD